MKLLGLKQPIPKHIREQAKAADFGRPDFYVGPVVARKVSPKDTPSTRKRQASLEQSMSKTEQAGQDAAKLRRDMRRERHRKMVARRMGSLRGLMSGISRRLPSFRRPRAAR